MTDSPSLHARLLDSSRLKEELAIFGPWWREHGHPEIPVEALPAVGIAVHDETCDRAVGWLYECNSAPVAWIEWITTNPNNTAFTSMRAVKALLDFMVLEAKRNGYVILLSTCRQKALGGILAACGFQQTDQNVSHYLRIVTA